MIQIIFHLPPTIRTFGFSLQNLISIKLRKEDCETYIWKDKAATATAAAERVEDISLSDNGLSVFEEGRYYIDDNEIEASMAALLWNILKHNDEGKLKPIRHLQIFFLDDNIRRCHARRYSKTVHLLLRKPYFFFLSTNRSCFQRCQTQTYIQQIRTAYSKSRWC